MDDARVVAAATARYEAFPLLLPKVLDDLKAGIDARDVKLSFEARVDLASAAAEATVRLVVGDVLQTAS